MAGIDVGRAITAAMRDQCRRDQKRLTWWRFWDAMHNALTKKAK